MKRKVEDSTLNLIVLILSFFYYYYCVCFHPRSRWASAGQLRASRIVISVKQETIIMSYLVGGCTVTGCRRSLYHSPLSPSRTERNPCHVLMIGHPPPRCDRYQMDSTSVLGHTPEWVSIGATFCSVLQADEREKSEANAVWSIIFYFLGGILIRWSHEFIPLLIRLLVYLFVLNLFVFHISIIYLLFFFLLVCVYIFYFRQRSCRDRKALFNAGVLPLEQRAYRYAISAFGCWSHVSDPYLSCSFH